MRIETLEKLSRDKLQHIIVKMSKTMTDEQSIALEDMIEEMTHQMPNDKEDIMISRMSQELVDEKMSQLEQWMYQIDEGELYLDADEYEDYSNGYWDSELITDYYDNQGIGNKLASIIQFAKECVNDRKYQEANILYDWLWEMAVMTDVEFVEPADLEKLIEEKIIREDIKQLALLTLYSNYQVKKPEERAEDAYLYFSCYAFKNLHIEDMFHVGRENLTGIEQFWRDWIRLLQTKNGDTESRLLKEAVLYNEGLEGLVKMADENYAIHPSLYLEAMGEYNKRHNYPMIEKIGEKAVAQIDPSLVIRGEIALKAACSASCLNHINKVMLFCWEGFRSKSTVQNFLRLFGTKEMAEQYGIRGAEVLKSRIKGEPNFCITNNELRKNIIGNTSYYTLSFYTGNFSVVKMASKNPQGSLGWSNCYIRIGIRLFLLYLFENPLPSKAAAMIADTIGFQDCTDSADTVNFENEIIDESRKYKTSIFWNYFQRWKQYFPMEQVERKQYISWAESIVRSRADAIVGGQHRRQYAEVAILLAMVAEIRAQMGEVESRHGVFAEYKKKFPRHSLFQAEMKNYFNMQ
ncbi:MAG: hypothetical protein PHW34_13900 [Hespellia sp.]|nr:hypothetical protein [Hespellia sp.]